MKNIKNDIIFLIYAILLGLSVGMIVWLFLRAMNLGSEALWSFIPSKLSIPFYTIGICLIGGLITGLWKKKYGDYPEELPVVIGNVKQTGRYSYKNILPLIICALLPLLFGSSVGPEAGLTGIIAALCTWVGDKLKKYRKESSDLASIGMSATLGTIFRSPMFGFIEPIESERESSLPKSSKIVLYLTAGISSFGIFILMNKLFGLSTGFEALSFGKADLNEYLYVVPLVIIGIFAGIMFFLFKWITASLKKKTEKIVISRAAVGGLLLGISGTFLPLTMFSGEHQITQIAEGYLGMSAAVLLITAVVKLLLTNICIESGLSGGHFFPVIFSGVAIGYAMGMIFGIDPVFCAACVTSALVGHTLKKPLATVLLLMIIFPIKLIPVMLIGAAAGSYIKTPDVFLEKEEANKK